MGLGRDTIHRADFGGRSGSAQRVLAEGGATSFAVLAERSLRTSMPKRRSIESIAFDVCIGIAVLFFLYALLLPHFHPSPMQSPPAVGSVSAAANTPTSTSTAGVESSTDPGKVNPSVASGDPSAAAPTEVRATSTATNGTPKTKASAAASEASDNLLPVMNYAVDAGVFQDQSNALLLAKRIWTRYQSQAVITPFKANGRTLYRVRLLAESKEKAENLAKSLLRDEKLQARVLQVQ